MNITERRTPWHQIGKDVRGAKTIKDCFDLAGMNWLVTPEKIYVGGKEVPGYQANVRDSDGAVMGITSDNYKIIQNEQAFSFANELVKEGVSFEKAGTYGKNDSRTWLLAKLPTDKNILGEKTNSFIVISNTFDGSGSMKVAIIPIRIACSNALNMALRRAQRKVTIEHMGNTDNKIIVAHRTLGYAEEYLTALNEEAERLQDISIRGEVENYISKIIPIYENKEYTDRQLENIKQKREGILERYYADDVVPLGDTAYRLINAVSDYATHAEPQRMTENYYSNMFARTINGNPLIDRTVNLFQMAA